MGVLEVLDESPLVVEHVLARDVQPVLLERLRDFLLEYSSALRTLHELCFDFKYLIVDQLMHFHNGGRWLENKLLDLYAILACVTEASELFEAHRFPRQHSFVKLLNALWVNRSNEGAGDSFDRRFHHRDFGGLRFDILQRN
jgi:hypothetical protein